jgi:dihydropyrimidine dehydrogenase (NAD+) subunit PreT
VAKTATHGKAIRLLLESALPDHKPTLTPGQAAAESNRCLYCHDAPCVTACPTGIDIPGFIRKIATDNLRGSARTILSANLLGYSCARVCPVEVLCAGACVHQHQGEPTIAIGRLQRYAVEAAFERGDAASLLRRKPANGKTVACVGAGPASLACAGYLALEGCTVTVYEKRALPGGLNTTGVAPYKMHVDDSLREVDLIQELGVTIKTGVEVGRDVTAHGLVADHDAVFFGVGLGADTRLGIPGEDGPGVSGATAWIERLKNEPGFVLGDVRRAVVIGGGNTAIDAARELASLGVPDVVMLYRRGEADMSGYAHELAHAREEGVRLIERAVPKEFVRDAGGALTGVLLADGRSCEADLALVAIGQAKAGAEAFAGLDGIARDARGGLAMDAATGRTGHPKVWVGGDAVDGELVVTAVQDGKRAARSIALALGLSVGDDAPMMAGHR